MQSESGSAKKKKLVDAQEKIMREILNSMIKAYAEQGFGHPDPAGKDGPMANVSEEVIS